MEQPTSQTAVFEYIDTYPFHTDSDFREGLAQILGHPEVPVVDEELNREDDLVLQAKCYYIARWENRCYNQSNNFRLIFDEGGATWNQPLIRPYTRTGWHPKETF